MSNSEGKVYPIVVRYAGIVSTIITDVAVIVDGVPHFVKAMWDTGANRTSLSSKLVEELRIVSGGTRSVQYHKGTDVALSDRFQRLVNMANYNREDKPPDHEEIKPTQNTGVKAAIMVLQLVMSYAGYWGEVTGEKSNEFFNALHTFVEALEKS